MDTSSTTEIFISGGLMLKFRDFNHHGLLFGQTKLA